VAPQPDTVFVRYTQPEKDQQLLLAQMNWELPPQLPPRITAKGEVSSSVLPTPVSVPVMKMIFGGWGRLTKRS